MNSIDQLIKDIESAFEAVVLGDGVGLWQGQALDDYATTDEVQAARDKDEKHDWRRLAPKDLNRCHSSLSFFDAYGMRFHLPAFMITDLRGEFEHSLEFSITHFFTDVDKDTVVKLAKCYKRPGERDKTNFEYGCQKFDILNQAQAKAVVSYLSYLLEQYPNDQRGPFTLGGKLEESLLNYWFARASIQL